MPDDLKVLNYLEAGMKIETRRQKAITNNLANMNTPGYRRKDVRFADELLKAIRKGRDADAAGTEIEYYQTLNTALNENNNDVSLDGEVGEMVKNNLQFKLYTSL